MCADCGRWPYEHLLQSKWAGKCKCGTVLLDVGAGRSPQGAGTSAATGGGAEQLAIIAALLARGDHESDLFTRAKQAFPALAATREPEKPATPEEMLRASTAASGVKKQKEAALLRASKEEVRAKAAYERAQEQSRTAAQELRDAEDELAKYYDLIAKDAEARKPGAARPEVEKLYDLKERLGDTTDLEGADVPAPQKEASSVNALAT